MPGDTSTMPFALRFRPRSTRRLLALLSCLCLAHPAAAHEAPPPLECVAPARPADDQNDVLWKRFLADVDAFRACISDYAEANNQAADVHRRAANAAIEQWNRFVHAELNVPEDYPWPPKQPQAR